MLYNHSALAMPALVPVPAVDFLLAFGGLILTSVSANDNTGCTKQRYRQNRQTHAETRTD